MDNKIIIDEIPKKKFLFAHEYIMYLEDEAGRHSAKYTSCQFKYLPNKYKENCRTPQEEKAMSTLKRRNMLSFFLSNPFLSLKPYCK